MKSVECEYLVFEDLHLPFYLQLASQVELSVLLRISVHVSEVLVHHHRLNLLSPELRAPIQVLVNELVDF